MKTTLPLSLAAIAAAVSLSTASAQTTPATTDQNATPPGTGTKAVEGDTRRQPGSKPDKYSKEEKDTTGKPTAKVPGTATPPGAGGRGIEGDTRRGNPNANSEPSTMGSDKGGGAPSGGTAGGGTSTPRPPDNPTTKTNPAGGSK
jgi:hypothetical protein